MNAHISDDKHKTVGTVATMTAAAQELGATTATRANEAATVVGEKIGSLATVIREKRSARRRGAPPHRTAVFPHPALSNGVYPRMLRSSTNETPKLKHARLPEHESGRRFRYFTQ